MPYKRASKRTAPKRVYKRKTYKRKAITRVRRPLPSSGFPAKQVVRLRYCTSVVLIESLGNLQYWNFRANSIYDPDATSTLGDHQPYGHDQWALIYNHYRVLGSKIRVQFMGTQGTTNSIVGIDLSDDTTVTTDYDTIREQPGSKYRTMTTQRPTTITRNFSSKKMFPMNVAAVNSPFGSNPTEQAVFNVYALAPSTITSVPAITAVVEIDYIVLLWELKELGKS